MTNNNVLVINGRSYDATTGQLLGPSDQPTHKTKTRSVDGFSVSKKSKTSAVKKQTVDEKISEPLTVVQQSSKRRGHAHDIILSKTVHGASTTKPLMRRGLKKPSKTSNPYAQPIAPIKTDKTSRVDGHQNTARDERAERIHRSSQVKHFSKHHSIEPRSGGTGNAAQPKVAAYQSKMMDTVTTQTNRLQNIIDRGMQKATSHDQESPISQKHKHRQKRSKPRIFNIVVGAVAVLIILGFIGYKSMPYIDIHIASAESGVHGEIPGYIPAGFKFEAPVKYGQGIVTVIFTSGTKSFRVIQQKSTWDSIGLKDSFVTAVDSHYTVVEAGGRIVYLYGQADATWVNAGIWYQITDNANFSTATLLKIATSL